MAHGRDFFPGRNEEVAGQEIVGAIIDTEEITSDLASILRAAAAGRHVDYVSRKRAETVASFRGGETYARLAKSPTLFIVQDGIRFLRSAGATTQSA
jgi:hypothetical protein